MKKLISFFLIIALLLPAAALSDLFDISGLSYDELLALRDVVNEAILSSSENETIKLDPGVWAVGIDFPAGVWLVSPLDNQFMHLWYGDKLNDSGTNAGLGWDSVNGYNKMLSTKKAKDGSWKDPDYPHFVKITMREGWYIINGGTVVLTRP